MTIESDLDMIEAAVQRIRMELSVPKPEGEPATSDYLYNDELPAWKNYEIWQSKGSPLHDSRGVPVDVRGQPITEEGKWIPNEPYQR